MIREIRIRNFRSIKDELISLEPLTVLVGANGSGKSNLVKAIEFLSDIPEHGLDLAVGRQGGWRGMVPKSIPENELSSHETSLIYTKALPTPEGLEEHLDSANVDHQITFKFASKKRLRVVSEAIGFHKALCIGHFLDLEEEEDLVSTASDCFNPSFSSKVSLRSMGTRPLNVAFEPKPTLENISHYLSWLGLNYLSDQVNTIGAFKNLVKNLALRSRDSQKKATKKARSLLDPDHITAFDFSRNFGVFRANVRSMRRYDLLLNELRREQTLSGASSLTSDGGNMPSALRTLSEDSDSESFSRLISTFEIIAPHIINTEPSALRNGKEFISFIESESGREVESWDSSDGSLRALAILLVLETTPDGSTIMIEEPEQNLHPWAIRAMIEHIKEVVEKKKLQVILTTHSEHVLERIEPRQLRVASRDHDTGTKYQRIDQILGDSEIQMGEVGQLWVKGLLGGVPA